MFGLLVGAAGGANAVRLLFHRPPRRDLPLAMQEGRKIEMTAREREREICVYIYIYMYICTLFHSLFKERGLSSLRTHGPGRLRALFLA